MVQALGKLMGGEGEIAGGIDLLGGGGEGDVVPGRSPQVTLNLATVFGLKNVQEREAKVCELNELGE